MFAALRLSFMLPIVIAAQTMAATPQELFKEVREGWLEQQRLIKNIRLQYKITTDVPRGVVKVHYLREGEKFHYQAMVIDGIGNAPCDFVWDGRHGYCRDGQI